MLLYLAHNRMLSTVTMNNLVFYSNYFRSLKLTDTTSKNDLQLLKEKRKTPIRLNNIKISTPMSTPHHPLLSLDNIINDSTEDDLPHRPHNTNTYENTFDDLIPADERIECMLTNQTNGINLFTYPGGIENTIRCQSPNGTLIDMSDLLDVLN